MAIAKLGVLVTGIRGTVGGATFSANKSGPYLRAWSKPPNPRTAYQSGQRTTLSWTAGQWRNLDPAERTAWDVWAALPAQEKTNSLGEAYYCSGFNWYVTINTRLERMAQTWRTDPPVQARPAAVTPTVLTIIEGSGGGDGAIRYGVDAFAGFHLVCTLAVSQGEGALTVYSGFLIVKQTATPHSYVENFATLMRLKLGYAIAGNKYHARLFKQTTDGLRSAPGTITTIAI